MDEAELDRLLVAAARAALAAGREILEVYRGGFTVDTKEDLSPITEADRRAHREILRRLGDAGAYPILSEEGRMIPFEERRHWHTFWLVDPLDGTKEFVKRNGEFTVNLALVSQAGPELGVVYAPVPDVLYFAHRQVGSYKLQAPAARVPGLGPRDGPGSPGGRDGAPEAVEAAEPAARILLAAAERLPVAVPLALDPQRRRPRLVVMTSRSHRGPSLERYLGELRRYADEIEVRSLGSALKPCVVAEGGADLYPRFGSTMEWDTAAAHAIVRGVGKRMIALDTERELVYNKPQLVNPSFLVL